MNLILGLIIGAAVGVISLSIPLREQKKKVKELENSIEVAVKHLKEENTKLEEQLSAKDVKIRGLELSMTAMKSR
jgi:predicted  nucleic acid-binding Zn-ribbon protein